MPNLTQQAEQELDKLVAAIPSTGKGAAHITVTNEAARVDIAHRWSPRLSSSAYWQKPRKGAATWGARTTFQW